MKKFILLNVLLSLILTAACSNEPSAPIESANVNNQPNTNTEIAQEANINLVPMKSMKNIEINANQLTPTVPSGTNTNTKVQQVSSAAPFDSSITTTMSKDSKFLETRTFRSDPLIQKIERLQELQKVTVYLKNGKKIDVPYDKGSTLFIGGSPQDILTAAGVKLPTAPPSVNPGKVEETTRDAVKKKTEN